MVPSAPPALSSLCAALLLAALPACGGNGRAAAPSASAFDAARAWRHVETLVGHGPRPSGSEALERSRVYLEAELRSCGLEPVREAFTADTPIGPVAMANLYADLPGRAGDAAPMLILAAHYETKAMDFPFVGANDNASGTGVLLELARVLAERGPGRFGYRFLFLDGEEAFRLHWEDPDNRYGSRHHAQRLKASRELDRFRAYVGIDMVGDADLQLDTDEFSDRRLLEAFFAAAREAGLGAHVGGTRQPIKDDHLSFLEVGLESVDLIDFEYGPGNRWWHTREDTLEKLSPESLGIAGRIVLLGLPRVEELLLAR